MTLSNDLQTCLRLREEWHIFLRVCTIKYFCIVA